MGAAWHHVEVPGRLWGTRDIQLGSSSGAALEPGGAGLGEEPAGLQVLRQRSWQTVTSWATKRLKISAL